MKVNTTYFHLLVVSEVINFGIHEGYWPRGNKYFATIIHYRGCKDHHGGNAFALCFRIGANGFVHQPFGDVVQLVFESKGPIALIRFTGIFKLGEAYKQVVGKQTEDERV
jgi:hypothetical protein